MTKKMIIVLALIAPSLTWAHGNIFDTTTDSIVVATAKFQSEDSAVVSQYKGLRAWHSGDVIKVRFYYGSDKESLLYKCEMQHFENGEEEIVCTME